MMLVYMFSSSRKDVLSLPASILPLSIYVLQEANHQDQEDSRSYGTAREPHVVPPSIEEANEEDSCSVVSDNTVREPHYSRRMAIQKAIRDESRSADSDNTVSGPDARPSPIPTSISVPNRARKDRELESAFATFIRTSFIISMLVFAIISMLASAPESSFSVFKVSKGAFSVLLYCAIAGIWAGQSAVVAFLAALQLHEEAKEEFVKFKDFEYSLLTMFFASRVPVTTDSNTEHKAGGPEDTLAMLSNFILVRAAIGSTIAAGIAGLQLSIAACCCHVFKLDEKALLLLMFSACVGERVGSSVGELAVADFLVTLKLYKGTVFTNANATKRVKASGLSMSAVVGFLVVLVTAFFISGLYETGDVTGTFDDGAGFVLQVMEERLHLGGNHA
jgi:hypothetical protein